MRRVIVIALAALLAALVATPVSAQENAEQRLAKYLTGNTAHVVVNGRNIYVYFRTLQKMDLWMKETNFSDRGSQTFKDAETFCHSWEKIRNGAGRCFRLKSISETAYAYEATDNGEKFEASIAKGNPQGF